MMRLSLDELEAFDPHAPMTTPERRFCCPLCGQGKPKDAAHRCLSVNVPSGQWRCHRCELGSLLTDFWKERPKMNPRDFQRDKLRRLTALPPVKVEVPQPDAEQERKADELRARFEKLPAIEGIPGEAYLRGRGVSLEVAQAAGVRFSRRWMPSDREESSRAAVVFPIFNRVGELVAAQGRYIDPQNGGAKCKTSGPKSRGVFAAAGAFDVPPFIITEAPIDALSLAVAGFPAVALCGKTGPDWLPKFCFGRTVFLGFDADDAGDEAAHKLAPLLESLGATCKRLRPEGAKDWNEFLCIYKRDVLAAFVIDFVF